MPTLYPIPEQNIHGVAALQKRMVDCLAKLKKRGMNLDTYCSEADKKAMMLVRQCFRRIIKGDFRMTLDERAAMDDVAAWTLHTAAELKGLRVAQTPWTTGGEDIDMQR